jgi:hypothetical protein
MVVGHDLVRHNSPRVTHPPSEGEQRAVLPASLGNKIAFLRCISLFLGSGLNLFSILLHTLPTSALSTIYMAFAAAARGGLIMKQHGAPVVLPTFLVNEKQSISQCSSQMHVRASKSRVCVLPLARVSLYSTSFSAACAEHLAYLTCLHTPVLRCSLCVYEG